MKILNRMVLLISQFGVTSIGNSAFFNRDTLLRVNIPNSVTSIEAYAFRYCIGLQNVIIPSSVISIESCAFEHCDNLQTVLLSEGLKSIKDYAFARCEKLHRVIVPSSVISIGQCAFSECDNLQDIVLSNTIGDEAVWSCYNLKGVTLLSNVTSIGKFAFWGYDKLPAIFIDSHEDEERTRVANLLLKELKVKVASKTITVEKIIQIQDTLLSKLLAVLETQPLYRCSINNAPFPLEIMCAISKAAPESNLFYQKAKLLINELPYPLNDEEMVVYKKEVEGIVDLCIQKAMKPYVSHGIFTQGQVQHPKQNEEEVISRSCNIM